MMTGITAGANSQEWADDRPAGFPNLRSAGRALAVALERYRQAANTVVLGIVSGGVPVAHEVASHLNAPLDLIFKRTLLAPQGPGSQLSAVNIAGSLVLPAELLPRPSVPSTPFDYFLTDAIAGLDQRERTCRGGRAVRSIRDLNLILVDCGIRTGLTMQPVITALRSLTINRIIVAVPVGSIDGCASIMTTVDEFVCLTQPEPFGHVGMWYEDFSRPADGNISAFLDEI